MFLPTYRQAGANGSVSGCHGLCAIQCSYGESIPCNKYLGPVLVRLQRRVPATFYVLPADQRFKYNISLRYFLIVIGNGFIEYPDLSPLASCRQMHPPAVTVSNYSAVLPRDLHLETVRRRTCGPYRATGLVLIHAHSMADQPASMKVRFVERTPKLSELDQFLPDKWKAEDAVQYVNP